MVISLKTELPSYLMYFQNKKEKLNFFANVLTLGIPESKCFMHTRGIIIMIITISTILKYII